MVLQYRIFFVWLLAILALCLTCGCEKSSQRAQTVSPGKSAEKPASSAEISRTPSGPVAGKAATQVQPVAPAQPARPVQPAPPANPVKEGDPAMRLYDRIQTAVDQGRMPLKEAVLLEAKLIYKPALLPADSPYRPGPQDSGFVEECLTGFNKDVHRVFPELNAEERELLKSLDPGLKTVIEQKEKEASKSAPGKP